MKINKVLKGLKCCSYLDPYYCKECPFFGKTTGICEFYNDDDHDNLEYIAYKTLKKLKKKNQKQNTKILELESLSKSQRSSEDANYTYGDWIRSMNDVELAGFINAIQAEVKDGKIDNPYAEGKEESIYVWLQQQKKDNDSTDDFLKSSGTECHTLTIDGLPKSSCDCNVPPSAEKREPKLTENVKLAAELCEELGIPYKLGKGMAKIDEVPVCQIPNPFYLETASTREQDRPTASVEEINFLCKKKLKRCGY